MKLSTEMLRVGKPTREEFPTLPRTPITLVLTHLKMENLGSVFRTADAFRVGRIIMCGVPYTPDSLRFRKAAKGTQRWVPHECRQDARNVVEELKSSGHTVYCLEQAEGARPHDATAYRFPAVLVMGKEKQGLSEDLLALADGLVEIPMLGMGNSLNVAVATGVATFAMLRRWQEVSGAGPRT